MVIKLKKLLKFEKFQLGTSIIKIPKIYVYEYNM